MDNTGNKIPTMVGNMGNIGNNVTSLTLVTMLPACLSYPYTEPGIIYFVCIKSLVGGH